VQDGRLQHMTVAHKFQPIFMSYKQPSGSDNSVAFNNLTKALKLMHRSPF